MSSLSDTIARAALSPFYQKHLGGRVRWGKLEELPFTTSEDLRQASPWGMFAVSPENIARIHSSSGTTGTPKIAGYTIGDLKVWRALMALALRRAGVTSGMKILVTFPYGMSSGGLGAHYAAETMGVAIPASGMDFDALRRLWDLTEPDVLLATPSYAGWLADQHVDTPFKIGIFGGEAWSEALRSRIERSLGLQAVDIYGLTEVMGPGVASGSADDPRKLRLWEDHFLGEIIDPSTGLVLPQGQEGELVLTTLGKEGMPLLRYRTSDITRFLGDAVLGPIRGRLDDRITYRGKTFFLTDIEAVIVGIPEMTTTWSIRVTQDDVMVYCESLLDECVSTLQERFLEILGWNVCVQASPVQKPHPGGKARRIL